MHNYRKIRDFHGSRQSGIGSSDLPVLAGYTKRFGSTPYTLWLEKTGRERGFQGNNRTWWGTQLEGLILKEWISRRTDNATALAAYKAWLRGRNYGPFAFNTECRHPEYPFAVAHADMLVLEPFADGDPENRIVEAKSSGFFAAKRGDDPNYGYAREDHSADGIPAAVYLQEQWQLFVYDVPAADTAVLVDTADYREYGPAGYDKRTIEHALALAERFWWHVEHDEPPKPETWDDIQKMFPETEETTAVVAGEDELTVRGMLERDGKLQAREKALKEERGDIKNAIGLYIGENKLLTDASGQVLAKSGDRERESVSLSDIKKHAPDLEKQLRDKNLIKRSQWRAVWW